MENLLLADQTRRQLTPLLKDTPHAILLVGPVGIGKKTVATVFATQLTAPQCITLVEPDEKGTISIETVRTLYQRTRSRQENAQVIVIDHAEGMGTEAQNAFLKLLEEPRAGVTFILTAPTQDVLLPTITSRAQSVHIVCVSQHALQQYAQGVSHTLTNQELAQLLFVANGRPATFVRLLQDPETFARYKQLMQQTKQLLTADTYDRLSLITTLTKNKEDAIGLLEAMARMLHVQLLREPNERWLQLAEGIQQCLARLVQNGNPRAQLTALFVNH